MAIHITSSTKPASICRPKSKAELRSLIDQELKRQGQDADLNFIGTSEITDMSFLFVYKPIGNIKIDRWDTSNVRDMNYMFTFCLYFNCDLSDWNVSNVENMSNMFDLCCSLDKLPKWYKGEQLLPPTHSKKAVQTSAFMSIVQTVIGILIWSTFIYVWFFL